MFAAGLRASRDDFHGTAALELDDGILA